MKVEIQGIKIRDFRMDPTGRFPVDPTLYNNAINATLRREFSDTRYYSSMPPIDMGDRDSLIRWMGWNDRNGCFTDEDCEAEGFEPFTLESAQDLFWEILTRD